MPTPGMPNEELWLEIEDLPMFSDSNDINLKEAWEELERLQRAGRMSARQLFALKSLLERAVRYGGWAGE